MIPVRATAFLVFACWAASAAAERGEDGVEVETSVCRLPEGRLTLAVASSRSCGRYCTTTHVHEVRAAGGEVLFATTDDSTEDGEDDPAPIELRCQRRQLALVRGELRVELGLSREGALELRGDLGARAESAWHAPPASEPAEIERRLALLELVRRLVEPEAERSVLGADRSLHTSFALLVSRDYLARDAWESTERWLPDVVRDSSDFADELAVRRERLSAELAARRARLAPIRLSPRRALSVVPAPLPRPIDVGEAPSLFFRGDDVCVVHAAKLPKLRCYDLQTLEAGPLEPVTLPRHHARDLRFVGFLRQIGCDGLFVVGPTVPDESEPPCWGGPGAAASDLAAIVGDDDWVLAGPSGLSAMVRYQETALLPETADEKLLRSAGSNLIGGSRLRFLEDSRLEVIGGDPEQRWSVLGPPPPEHHWVSVLVSPDQRTVIAQSRASQGGVAIWCFRVLQGTG